MNRLSMWSQAAQQCWLETAMCPKCQDENLPTPRLQPIALNADGNATCNTCGYVWPVVRKLTVTED